jgi:glycosyltransferase involved in cell wall biosynthesis
MKIYIQLPPGLFIEDWTEEYVAGKIFGLNEESPYGYKRIEEYGHQVSFSDGSGNSLFSRIIRKFTGLNLVAVLKNRKSIFNADVVWTHLETDAFGVAFLSFLYHRKINILGQSVWLIDQWNDYSFLKRWIYKSLVMRINILTFHSPLNENAAKELFSNSMTGIVKFGISSESKIEVRTDKLSDRNQLNIVSMGNDMHRDWKSLVREIKDKQGVTLTILSSKIAPSLIENINNIKIRRFDNNNDYLSFLQSCDLMIIPLKPNWHASGLTAIQEAIILGIPVVATNVGGLDYYFDDSMLTFYNEPSELELILSDVSLNYDSYLEKSRNAQKELDKRKIGCRYYIEEQIELSKKILNEKL